MAEKKRRNWIILGIFAFLLYILSASVPIPKETVLEHRWVVSAEDAAATDEADEDTIAFVLPNRVSHVDSRGNFSVNTSVQGYAAVSDTLWAEYGPIPESIDIKDPRGNTLATIASGRGYPAFIAGRTFLVAPEQQTLYAVDLSGALLWSYEFAAPLTALDATESLVLAACLDGSVTVLDGRGKQTFTFEPGGSRLSIVLAARISDDGKRIALISGIDAQRFLLLERFGTSYKVSYHEFLEEGFRRPVHLAFVDQGRRVVFEREQGVGIYDIKSGKSSIVPLSGELIGLEDCGEDGRLFLVGAKEDKKYLVGINDRMKVVVTAPFSAGSALLRRKDGLLYIGGDSTLAAFALREK